MYRYSTSQLSIIIAVPAVTVLLLWTLTIFYKNKKQWRPYDICIVSILFQSVLRNLSTLCYTVLTILSQSNDFPSEYCASTVWLFNSLHTFQASTLSTLSVVGLYIIKLSRNHKEIKQYLTSTHIVYHLFCLTTLCACVGVAAILARRESQDAKSANFDFNYARSLNYSHDNSMENCRFMPYELDVKYNIFILSLHSLLAFVSIVCFLGILITFYKYKKNGFDYLKKSTSDLSDLSIGAAASTVSQKDEMAKHYFDTYQKSNGENTYLAANRPDGVYSTGKKSEPWTSDTSNISTSVSSTNSRRPCLMKKKKEQHGAGLETTMPVLIVCYLFNHLPVVVVCVFPWLPNPWTTAAGAALCLCLAQDILLPTALGLVDGRFNTWVSKAYRCGRDVRKRQQEKPPKGLDGKFRPFTNTTQSLESAPMVQQARTRPNIPPPMNLIISSDHKFPITNGSLYTSIDGRLPIIHNYRRHKGLRSPVHSISMGLHSTYVKRQESLANQHLPSPPNHFIPSEPCDESFLSLPADYSTIDSLSQHSQRTKQLENNVKQCHLSSSHICPSQQQKHSPKRKQIKLNLRQQHRKLSASQNSLTDVSIIENELRKMRASNISKSQSNLNEINITQRDIQKFKINPEMYQKQNLNLNMIKKISEKEVESSDDEYFNQSVNYTDDCKNYDTISSISCYSITTEANGDFEFFAQQNSDSPPSGHSSYQLDEINGNLSRSPIMNDSYIMKLNPNLSPTHKSNFPVMRSFKPLMCKSANELPNIDYSNNNKNKDNKLNHKCSSSPDKHFRIRRSNSKQSLNNLDTYIKDSSPNKLERSNSNRSYDLFRNDCNNSDNKGTYIIRSNSNRSYDIMRSNPNITETNLIQRKPSVSHINFKNLNTSCIHFNNKNDVYNKNIPRDNIKYDKHRVTIPVLSMESLTSMLNQKGISYLDNGDICNHNYGGSVPDFKKVFVTDFI